MSQLDVAVDLLCLLLLTCLVFIFARGRRAYFYDSLARSTGASLELGTSMASTQPPDGAQLQQIMERQQQMLEQLADVTAQLRALKS